METSKQSTACAVGSSVENGDINAIEKDSADTEKAGNASEREDKQAFGR